MGLRNLAILELQGTELSALEVPVSATAVELVTSPNAVTGGLQFIRSDQIDEAMRTSLTFRAKSPVYDAKAKTWSKGRREIALVEPREVTPGSYQAFAIRTILEVPTGTDTEHMLKSLDMMIQVLKDSATEIFLKTGSSD